jgi:hypothetical protein
MFSKTSFKLMAAIAAGALMIGSFAKADTITVTSLPNSTASVAPVVGGVYNGDESYTYSVDLDPTTVLNAGSGDGFMVIDFGPIDDQSVANPGFTLSGGTVLTVDGADFTESTQTTGTGLNGYTGNTAGKDNFVDASNSLNTANPTDSAAIDNAVFTYNGLSDYTATGDVDLTLSLYTTNTSVPKLGNSFGVDNSGAENGLSFELKSVYVPSAPVGVPLPANMAGGGVLLGLAGLARVYRARRSELA